MKRQNPGQLVVKFKLLVMKKKNKRFHTSMYVVCQIERLLSVMTYIRSTM